MSGETQRVLQHLNSKTMICNELRSSQVLIPPLQEKEAYFKINENNLLFLLLTYSMFNNNRTEIENICHISPNCQVFDFQKKKKGQNAPKNFIA